MKKARRLFARAAAVFVSILIAAIILALVFGGPGISGILPPVLFVALAALALRVGPSPAPLPARLASPAPSARAPPTSSVLE